MVYNCICKIHFFPESQTINIPDVGADSVLSIQRIEHNHHYQTNKERVRKSYEIVLIYYLIGIQAETWTVKTLFLAIKLVSGNGWEDKVDMFSSGIK